MEHPNFARLAVELRNQADGIAFGEPERERLAKLFMNAPGPAWAVEQYRQRYDCLVYLHDLIRQLIPYEETILAMVEPPKRGK